MSQGPFLYDDDPAPLHTGTPRTRNGLVIAIVAGTALFAVLMVGLMTWSRGTPGDQAREVATVFTRALAAGDTSTALDLVCDDERARLGTDGLAGEYLHPGTPTVTGTRGGEVDGGPAQYVQVRWDDGGTATTTELTVVPEGGTKVCGTRPAA